MPVLSENALDKPNPDGYTRMRPTGFDMPHLIMRGETVTGSEIQLQPGRNRLGRAEDNDQPIDHPSVSGHHCEIEVGPEGTLARDLQSTNGTFIDGEPVTEAWLHPGQILQLGAVTMVYQEDPQPAPQLLIRTRTQAVATVAEPVRSRPVQAGVPVQQGRARRAQRTGAAPGFFTALPTAFSYPFKRNGLIVLLCGAVFFGFLELATMVLGAFAVGFLGLAYWIALIISVGYLFAFMQTIITSSTLGEDSMPGFPEISGFYDAFFLPFLRLVTIGVACCGPGILTMFLVSPIVGVAVLLLGLFCMPMALLTVSLADSISGLNPIVILSGIAKVPGAYLITCLVFLLAIGVMSVIELLIEITGIPLLPTFLGMFVSLYLITVEMRVLGLLYYTNRKKLAWFD